VRRGAGCRCRLGGSHSYPGGVTKTVGLIATPIDPRIQSRSSEGRRMPQATLRVAVAQPVIRLNDLRANVASHVDSIRAADSRIVIFPELSLTGYDLEAPVVDLDDPLLKDLVAACAEAGSVALVGAPVGEDDRLSIATLRVDAEGVSVAYRKTWLHGEEFTRFTPGSGPSTIDVDGWVVGASTPRRWRRMASTSMLPASWMSPPTSSNVRHAPSSSAGRWQRRSRSPASRGRRVGALTRPPVIPRSLLLTEPNSPKPTGGPAAWCAPN